MVVEPLFELRTVAVRDDGAFGVLLFKGRPFAVTCERTFENNRIVIPPGVSRCKRDFYHAGGYRTYEIFVPGHSLVKFHKGNKELDSAACVLVAESFAEFNGKTFIADSKGGFEEFMRLADGVPGFDLLVSGR